jgi:predicted Zn-dependent peptidase
VAVAAGGFPGLPGRKYPGLFLFYAFNAPGKTNADVEKALDDEIRRLRDEPVSADELEGVKNRARAGLMRQLDNNQVLAMQLSEYQQLTGDWRNLFRDLERIEKVTPDDIQRVAKAAFVKTNRTVGAIEPRQTAAAK